MTLSDQMKNQAISHGLCAQWTSEWKDDSSKEILIDKFIRGLDFCIKHEWPSVEQIDTLFKKEDINAKGVYCNQKVELYNPKYVVLNGECDADITVEGFTSEIWVRHNSKLRLSAMRCATVYIKMLDNADVEIDCGFFSKVYAYRYDEGVKLTNSGDVIERDRVGFYKNGK